VQHTRVVHCVCCALEQPAPPAARHIAHNAPRCVRCVDHDGTSLAEVARREADHAQLYRRALADAQDEIFFAHSERDVYADRTDAAYATRELLVRALSQIDAHHHYRGSRCSCGRRGCRVVEVLADPRVSRLVRSYDEEKRTLRELRIANPELWGDSWDDIDVTLVYPKPRKKAAGRHRAG
jgi:hypothetical protein